MQALSACLPHVSPDSCMSVVSEVSLMRSMSAYHSVAHPNKSRSFSGFSVHGFFSRALQGYRDSESLTGKLETF
jgi:hypothetical protein